MKRTKKSPLWYNPVEKGARRALRESELVLMAADKEGRALLESYCRMYQMKL